MRKTALKLGLGVLLAAATMMVPKTSHAGNLCIYSYTNPDGSVCTYNGLQGACCVYTGTEPCHPIC